MTHLVGFGKEFEQLPIVVSHLLEMGSKPFPIHGVAGKASAQVIVDPSHPHFLEGKKYSLTQVFAGTKQRVIQHKVPNGGHGKFGYSVHSAPFWIKLGCEFGDHLHQFVRIQFPLPCLDAVFVGFLTIQTSSKAFSAFRQLVGMPHKGIRYATEQLLPFGIGEVGASVKGLLIGHQEDI